MGLVKCLVLAAVLAAAAVRLRGPLRRALVRWTGTEVGQVRSGSPAR